MIFTNQAECVYLNEKYLPKAHVFEHLGPKLVMLF